MTIATPRIYLLLSLAFHAALQSGNAQSYYESYPTQACILGDVQAALHENRDARLWMGDYEQINPSGFDINTDIVDMTAPIYQRTATGNLSAYDVQQTEDRFLFRVFGIGADAAQKGWLVAENLALADTQVHIYATCHFEDLFDCIYNRWFWGFDSFEYDVPLVQASPGPCQSSICIRNLTLNVSVGSSAPYSLRDFGSTLVRSVDPEWKRYTWVSPDFNNTALNTTRAYWKFRFTETVANWVYIGVVDGAEKDLVACAPGAVESPLYCTAFSYAAGNSHLPTDKMGAAEFKMGVCEETQPPTTEPTFEPTMSPTLEPSAAPTITPRCAKEFIFRYSDGDVEVPLECPFGYLGTGITRYCQVDGEWSTVSDDCSLLSFTDDFYYYRDELWRDTNVAYANENETALAALDTNTDFRFLTTFPALTGPLRIDFTVGIESATCGGIEFGMGNDIRAYWDCATQNVQLDEESATQAAATAESTLTGYMIYREGDDGNATLIFKAFADATPVQVSYTNRSFFAPPQPLYVGIRDVNTTDKSLTLQSISLTSFVDWFDSPRAAIWSTYPLTVFHFLYSSSHVSVLDELDTRSSIQFTSADALEADSSKFQFIAPFTIDMLYGATSLNDSSNDGMSAAQFTITLTTATSNGRNVFIPDTDTYDVAALTIEFTDGTLTVNGESTDYEPTNSSACTLELLVRVSVAQADISVTVLNEDGATECAVLQLSDTSLLDASSRNYDSLRIAPMTDSLLSVSYLAVTSDAFDDTVTLPPTSNPTMAPTTACVYDNATYAVDEAVIRACSFGWYGLGDQARCTETGEVGAFEQRCFKTSFADDFRNNLAFDDELWYVYESEGVNGAATAALDGSDSLRFLPDDPSRVGILRSQYRIAGPMRVRAEVEKRADECNLWSIALGSHWAMRKPDSTRLVWNCNGGDGHKQWSLYNDSYKLFDTTCWTTDVDSTADSGMLVQLSLQQGATPRDGSSVRTNVSSCAPMALPTNDIFNDTKVWQDAYVFFGTYYDDAEIQGLLDPMASVIGRFHSMYYTQFFSEFDTYMTHVWDVNASSAVEEDLGGLLLLQPDEVLVSDTDLFQFSIPFTLKIGIERPVARADDEWTQGEYAHAIVIGGVGYSPERRNDTVQIVYDSNKGVKLVYTATNVYATGFDDDAVCQWTDVSETDVTIVVDATKISVHDSICDDTTIIATHHLTTVDHTLVSLAFIHPRNADYGDSQRIGFTYIEAYQYQARYASVLVDDVHMNDSAGVTLTDTDVIYPGPEEDNTILGMPVWLFALIVAIVVLCCCAVCCAVLHKLKIIGNSEKLVAASRGAGSGGRSKSREQVGNTSVGSLRQQSESQVPSASVAANSNGNEANQQLIPQANNGNGFVAAHQHVGSQMSASGQPAYGGGGLAYGGNAMNGNAMNGNAMNGNMWQQQMQMNMQGMNAQQQQQMQMALYQQQQMQLFYQQQFMQAMMNDQQQKQILMSMDAPQRKVYIEQQMMAYMARIAEQPQPQMAHNQQMAQQYYESNAGSGGDGEGEGGGGISGMNETGFMEGNLNTNVMANMGGSAIELQSMEPQQAQQPALVNILQEFEARVDLDSFFELCGTDDNGEKTTDANRARILIAKYRGISPMKVHENDEAIMYFSDLTIFNLRAQLQSLPGEVYVLLKGNDSMQQFGGGAGGGQVNDNDLVDYLVDFDDKVRMKQVFTELQSQQGSHDPRIDAYHARVMVSNLRSVPFGNVSEADPAVALLVDKSLVELRAYLGQLPMRDLRMFDLKAYHNYAQGGGGGAGGAAGGGGGANAGFALPVIQLHMNGNIQQFKPPKFACFGELMSFIMRTYNNVQSFKLMYHQDDGQWVRISTDTHIQECLKLALESHKGFVDINIII